MIGIYGIAFWLPTIVKGFGVQGYWSVGLLSAIPFGVATIGMVIISLNSDRTGERRWHYALNSAAVQGCERVPTAVRTAFTCSGVIAEALLPQL